MARLPGDYKRPQRLEKTAREPMHLMGLEEATGYGDGVTRSASVQEVKQSLCDFLSWRTDKIPLLTQPFTTTPQLRKVIVHLCQTQSRPKTQESHSFTTPHDGLCPLCKSKGQHQALQSYRINFTQSIYLCSNPRCIYPLGYTSLDNIISDTGNVKNVGPQKQKRRTLSDLSPSGLQKLKKSKLDVPSLAQHTTVNGVDSLQAERIQALQVIPNLELERTLKRTSPCGQAEMREILKQNITRTEGLLPVPLDESPQSNCSVSGSSTLFHNGQEMSYEGLLQNGIVKPVGLSNGCDVSDESFKKLLRTGDLNPGAHPTPERTASASVFENGMSSNGDVHVLESSSISKKDSTDTEITLLADHLLGVPETIQDSWTQYGTTSKNHSTVGGRSNDSISVIGTSSNVIAIMDDNSDLGAHSDSQRSSHGSIQTPSSQAEGAHLTPERTASASIENGKTSNGDSHVLEGSDLDTDSMHFSQLKILRSQHFRKKEEPHLLLRMQNIQNMASDVQDLNSVENGSSARDDGFTDYSQPPLAEGTKFGSPMKDRSPQEVSDSSVKESSVVPVFGSTSTEVKSACTCDSMQKSLPSLSKIQHTESLQNGLADVQESDALAWGSCTPDECRDFSPSHLIEKKQFGLQMKDSPSQEVLNLTEKEDRGGLVGGSPLREEKSAQSCDSMQSSLQSLKSLSENLDSYLPQPTVCVQNGVDDEQDFDRTEKCSPTQSNNLGDFSQSHFTQRNQSGSQMDSSSQEESDSSNLPDCGSTLTEEKSSQPCGSMHISLPSLSKNLEQIESVQSIADYVYSAENRRCTQTNEHSDLSPFHLIEGNPSSNVCVEGTPQIEHASQQGGSVKDCLHINSGTSAMCAVEQESPPDFQSDEKSFNPVLCTSSSATKDRHIVDSDAILLPDEQLGHQVDSGSHGDCEITDQGTKAVNDDDSWMETSDLSFPSVSEKDGTDAEISLLADHLLLGTPKPNHNCLPHFGADTPYKNPDTVGGKSNDSISNDTGTSSNLIVVTNDDRDLAIHSDSQGRSNRSSQAPNSQVEGIQQKDASPHTAAAINKLCSVTSRDTPLLDLSLSKECVKKTFENAVLPDLLLDIQLDHCMEEPLSAAPSPTYDADVVMTTVSSGHKQSEDIHSFLQELHEQSEPEMDNSKTETTVSSDDLQNSINVSHTSEDMLNDECLESEPLEVSALIMKQSLLEKLLEVRTYENSQRRMQWKNRNSLCWLDCILSALVQSRALCVFVAEHPNNMDSIIYNLFANYEEANSLCPLNSRKNRSGRPTKSEICLHDVRMLFFDRLQPLLKCELGHMESPVFALPLLLKLDPDFQKLFVHSFSWKFRCESCGYTYQERCEKTLTTFTNIVHDWRPLHAVHRSPCNKCQAVDQKREMSLERLQPIFMIHFVEGLPSSDLKAYSFRFGEHCYEIKTVIKYRDQHFSTWSANDDDTWLESDGLKGWICRRHHMFKMRAEDIHIAIWERSNSKPSSAVSCTESPPQVLAAPQSSPSSPSAKFPLQNVSASKGKPLASATDSPPQVASVSEINQSSSLPDASENRHLPSSTEHPPEVVTISEIRCSTQLVPQAASASESKCLIENPLHTMTAAETNLPALSIVPTSDFVASLNTSNPLDGMDDYSDNDIITLTLVEVPLDSLGRPIENSPNLKLPVPCVTPKEANPVSVLQPLQVEAYPGVDFQPAQVQVNPDVLLQPAQVKDDPCIVLQPAQVKINPVVVLQPAQIQISPDVVVQPAQVKSAQCILQSTQIKANPVVVLHPLQEELKNEYLQHLQPFDSTGKCMPVSTSSSDLVVANSTVQKSPIKPCNRTQPSGNMLPHPVTTSTHVPDPVTTSTPVPKPFSNKKGIAGRFMSSLVKKDSTFLSGNLCSASKKDVTSKPWQPCHLLKETDFNGIPKKAENFEGFRIRNVKTANPPTSNTLLTNFERKPSTFSVPKEKTTSFVKSCFTPVASSFQKPATNGFSSDRTLANSVGVDSEEKVRKLRSKLLKKLKAKKHELAMLEKMSGFQRNGSSTCESNRILQGGINRKQHLQGFLQELQDHIDRADNESVCTASSRTSICSSPGDAEFFAELFSPSPVDNPESDGRFLEMLADGCGISSNHSHLSNGTHHSMNNSTLQSTSGTPSIPNTLNLSGSGEDTLNIMSASALAMLNDDTEYLSSFDDIF
ncbi:SUMO-specific isopeptidase USPL1 [Hyperolius riggenbachi]|uniref:SUMO-specific isopeptidase USPL1 n=1 Tax=Hyperolius riggenbachi TaxID=752182 RepID=UPI0035A30DD8